MKATRTVLRQNVQQAMAKGHCPICTLLTDFQSQLIEDAKLLELTRLCNYHAWTIAKASPADLAARVFRRMLERSQAFNTELACDLCDRIRVHGLARTVELVQQMQNPSVRQWMKLYGSLCIVHAKMVEDTLPSELRGLVATIMSRNRAELLKELTNLLGHLDHGNRSGWGSSGRAAEFLVSQRGISR